MPARLTPLSAAMAREVVPWCPRSARTRRVASISRARVSADRGPPAAAPARGDLWDSFIRTYDSGCGRLRWGTFAGQARIRGKQPGLLDHCRIASRPRVPLDLQ